jgi:hypothetical protein
MLDETIRNTVIGYALSEAVFREPQLKHYQQRFISSWPFQLLGQGYQQWFNMKNRCR